MSRARGYIDNYNPRTKTRELLSQVEDVLDTYQAELPLTARQVFYRLVATVDFPKDEKGYGRLQEHLANFRRAGIVPFAHIRDDGATIEAPLEYASPEEFLRIAEELARDGQGVRLEGQPRWVEVWCEAAGMAPQLARAVGEFGVTVYSSGGFDSLTIKHEAAQRMADREVPTTILHIGDFDPSGVALFHAVAEDVGAFVTSITSGIDVEFKRIAVTPDQIRQHNLPGQPPKTGHGVPTWREDGDTVQAEALPPDVLSAEVRQAVESELDMAAFAKASETEAANRDAIEDILRQLRGDDNGAE